MEAAHPSPPLSPDECYYGEKWHGQLERAEFVLLVIFLFGPVINASNRLQFYQLNRNKSTVGAFFRFAHLVLVGHDNISDIFLIQARQNADHTFFELQRGLGECFYFPSVFYFSPHRIINALMHSPQPAAQNIGGYSHNIPPAQKRLACQSVVELPN